MRSGWLMLVLLFLPYATPAAESVPNGFRTHTIFVVPWDKEGAFSHYYPTQSPDGFRPAIKSPAYFDVDPKGFIYIGSNAYLPAEIRKYDFAGNLLWKIYGASTADRMVPLDVRKFCRIGSFCCDDEGNLYVAEELGYHEDKLAKYGPNGQFLGMIRTGFSYPALLNREAQGGIRFSGIQKDAQTGEDKAHLCMLKNGIAWKAAPEALGLRGPDRECYGGLFHKGLELVEYEGETRRKVPIPNPMREILIARYNRQRMEEGSERHEHTVRIGYPHPLGGCWTLGADLKGRLYVDIAIDSSADVPSSSTHRLLMINPAAKKILGEVNLVPGAQTVDMLSYPPVIIPETGEVYEFADLRDGLHVIKHTPIVE